MSRRVVRDLNPQSLGEHLNASGFDWERFWLDREDRERAQSYDFMGDRRSRSPIRSEAGNIRRRPLLSILVDPRTPREQLIAWTLFILLDCAVFAIFYALLVGPAWLIRLTQLFS